MKQILKLSIVFIIILILSIFAGVYFTSSSYNNIIFVDKIEMRSIIDGSPFFSRMSPLDLKVRNVTHIEHYKMNYYNNIQNFTDKEKKYLENLVSIVEKHTHPYKNISKIKWKFCKVSSNIENGFPHTIRDVIVLSENFLNSSTFTDNDKGMTILHEKIHIFQRQNPIETHDFIKTILGMDVYVVKDTDFAYNFLENRRNNPDINNLSYSKNNFIIVQLYAKDPKTLSDSSPFKISINEESISPVTNIDLNVPEYVKQLEHPYEIMACYIPPIIFKTESPINATIQEWLIKNF